MNDKKNFLKFKEKKKTFSTVYGGKNLLKLRDDHVNFWKVKNILVINKLQMGEVHEASNFHNEILISSY